MTREEYISRRDDLKRRIEAAEHLKQNWIEMHESCLRYKCEHCPFSSSCDALGRVQGLIGHLQNERKILFREYHNH